MEPTSPKLQPSGSNRYTVRVYRSPLQTNGDGIAIAAVSLYGRLYAKVRVHFIGLIFSGLFYFGITNISQFLKRLDNVLIPQAYPEVSSMAVDRTTSGPYSFTEPTAKLNVVSAPPGWTVEPDIDTV